MTFSIWFVLGLALLPAAGNFAGGLLAEWLRPTKQTVGYAIHAAAGIILAVVAVEVMPEALRKSPAWLLALTFLGGGVAYLFVENGIERWQQKRQSVTGAGAWMVYVAVSADLMGDGLLIGTGSAVSGEMAFLLAVGQVLADIPEGFAVIANFRDKGVGRAKRILLSASLLIPVVAAAVLAYFALRSQSEVVKFSALVFVAGLYTLAAVEDMLREAHDTSEDTRFSAISFLSGFALFLLVSEELS